MENPSYNFSYVTGEDPERFLLHFFNPAYGLDDKSANNQMLIYSFDNEVYVRDMKGTPVEGELVVYNMIGQEITRQSIESGNAVANVSLNVHTGYYVVKLITDDSVYSGKVFLTE